MLPKSYESEAAEAPATHEARRARSWSEEGMVGGFFFFFLVKGGSDMVKTASGICNEWSYMNEGTAARP